jgi:hypothetical protein
MCPSLKDELGRLVIGQIQETYSNRQLRKTIDCIDDMEQDGLYEADVEKVIMNSTNIEKVMPTTSERASNPNNTHYVIYGESTAGVPIYCKICSNYHKTTNVFICWTLTSFCNRK